MPEQASSATQRTGLFGGLSAGRIVVDSVLSHDVGMVTVSGGVYTTVDLGHAAISTILTAGHISHESSRTVANNLVAGGVQVASADYDASGR